MSMLRITGAGSAGVAIVDSNGNEALVGQQAQANSLAITPATDNYDEITRAIKSIDYEHHEIHDGSHYFVSGFETVANDGDIIFSITTPNTAKWIHLIFEIEGTSQTEFSIYETASVSSGTPITPNNNNRNSANTSDVTMLYNPTVDTAGTVIFAQSKGKAGTNPLKADTEGLVNRSREIILKQNTTYVFEIISRDDGNIISYAGEWYEHTNKSND